MTNKQTYKMVLMVLAWAGFSGSAFASSMNYEATTDNTWSNAANWSVGPANTIHRVPIDGDIAQLGPDDHVV